ncbi:MAG: hypothetical protein R2752_22120 [Vicinamibacterales bacterium]
MTSKRSGTPSDAPRETRTIDRRRFLTGLAAGAGLAPLVSPFGRPLSAGAGASQTPDLCYSTQKPLLSANDFTYQGYYDVQTSGNDTTYAQGLTHRYVNGEVRLLMAQLHGRLHEFSLGGQSFGSTIRTVTNDWPLTGATNFIGLWFDQASDRLWMTTSYDYFADYSSAQITTRTLNSNGSVSNIRGPVGLAGITQKRIYGGAQAIPAWFQNQYGVGPYAVGWGGYTSLVSSGGVASMGLTAYAIPDPSSFPANSEIPASQFRVMADHVSGTTGSSGGAGSSYDRGWRLTPAQNYYDGGDPRSNPSTPPTSPPQASGQWLMPLSDGKSRFMWGDSYYNTGNWVETPTRQGFIAVACLGGGKGYYANSTLNSDYRLAELHVFNPTHFGECITGARQPWAVQPASMKLLDLPGLGNGFGLSGNWPPQNAAGATYDPIGRKLYIAGFAVNTFYARIYVFSVA